jgi:hypothetical protein
VLHRTLDLESRAVFSLEEQDALFCQYAPIIKKLYRQMNPADTIDAKQK